MRLPALAVLLLLAAAGRAAAQGVVESTGEGKGWSWTMTVPRLGARPADAALDAWAGKQLEEFLALCKDERAGQPGTWRFILTASTFPPAGPYASVRLDAWSYTGGAHGNTRSEGFVFERKTGRRLALADLFKPGSKYLDELSRRSVPLLVKSLGGYGDPEWIAKGAAPTAENYALFALAGDRLFLFFPAYQVGPYVSGPQTVRLPLSSLRALLRPELARP